jgi:hypothetical protein
MSSGSDAYRRQSVLTSGPSETMRLCLEKALREGIALATGRGGDMDRLRKLLSLARQGCVADEPGPGRDLHDVVGHMLVRISSPESDALAETVGLLSILVGAIRDWRGTISGATIPAWDRVPKP